MERRRRARETDGEGGGDEKDREERRREAAARRARGGRATHSCPPRAAAAAPCAAYSSCTRADGRSTRKAASRAAGWYASPPPPPTPRAPPRQASESGAGASPASRRAALEGAERRGGRRLHVGPPHRRPEQRHLLALGGRQQRIKVALEPRVAELRQRAHPRRVGDEADVRRRHRQRTEGRVLADRRPAEQQHVLAELGVRAHGDPPPHDGTVTKLQPRERGGAGAERTGADLDEVGVAAELKR